MIGERQADLYAGDPALAHRLIAEQWRELDDSLLLLVQLTRLEAYHLRARVALALGHARPAERRALLRAAEQDCDRIQKERMPWADPLAGLVRAGIAATSGDADRAEAHLREAALGFDRADMALYAAAARWQRGRLTGGDEGASLVQAADKWMADQGVVSRPRMVAMLAPGFPP
jgi:hypothetical protein